MNVCYEVKGMHPSSNCLGELNPLKTTTQVLFIIS